MKVGAGSYIAVRNTDSVLVVVVVVLTIMALASKAERPADLSLCA